MPPLVTVIVPCFNYAAYLAEALDSVLSQTYQDWECIIVNDGSSDNTEEVALDYCEKDKRFSYYSQENKGVIAARNKGLEMAKGKYVLPLDGDDKIAPTYIKKGVSVLENNEFIRVVYCKASYFGEMKGEVELAPFSMEKLLIRNMIFSSALHHKVDSERIGGYNDTMKKGLEDWDYWISILKDGGEAYQISEILFYYRRRMGTRSDSFTFVEEAEIRQQIYQRHSQVYKKYFGDPINMLREKERFAAELRKIRSQIVYKIFRNLKLLP